MTTRRLSVPFSPELRARVEATAAETGMQPGEWVAGAVAAYLDWQDAEKRAAEAMKTAS